MKATFLALETSTRQTSVAVWKNGHVAFHEKFMAERRQTGPLASTIAAALRSLDALKTPDEDDTLCNGIVVGIGPGSYNGLRAAAALGRGLGFALNVPVGGWCSFLGLPPGNWIVGADARAGQWVLAVLANGILVENPTLVPALAGAELAEKWTSLEPGKQENKWLWLGENPPSSRWECHFPTADYLAEAAANWWKKFPQVPQLTDWPAAVPLYLKPPHITGGPRGLAPESPAIPAR